MTTERTSSELEMPTVSCLRCGATYPEGAVVCFRCGAPIGDTSIPTQPVRRSQAIPPEDVSSPPIVYRGGQIEQDRVPTRPRAPSQAALVIVKKRPVTPAERWERRGRFAFGIFLAVLVAAALGGAAMGVHALLAGPSLPNQTLYQDPQHRFHFKRPALWNVTPAPDGVLLTDTAGTSTVHITVATPDPNETAESYATTLGANQNLGVDAPQPFAGAQWQVLIGDVTGRDGVVREVEDFVTEYGGQRYVIELSSPIASFDGTDNVVFQPLLASFQFA